LDSPGHRPAGCNVRGPLGGGCAAGSRDSIGTGNGVPEGCRQKEASREAKGGADEGRAQKKGREEIGGQGEVRKESGEKICEEKVCSKGEEGTASLVASR
jgi:hypothetical protein